MKLHDIVARDVKLLGNNYPRASDVVATRLSCWIHQNNSHLKKLGLSPIKTLDYQAGLVIAANTATTLYGTKKNTSGQHEAASSTLL